MTETMAAHYPQKDIAQRIRPETMARIDKRYAEIVGDILLPDDTPIATALTVGYPVEALHLVEMPVPGDEGDDEGTTELLSEPISFAKYDQWREIVITVLSDIYGERNLIGVVEHRTGKPHIHFLAVTEKAITERMNQMDPSYEGSDADKENRLQEILSTPMDILLGLSIFTREWLFM